MHRQLVSASSRRLDPSGPIAGEAGADPGRNRPKTALLALAGAAVLLLGCQDGSDTAPGGLEPSPSSQRSETDRGTPGSPAGSDFSGARPGSPSGSELSGAGNPTAGAEAGSADEANRASGAGTGAGTSAADDSDGDSDDGSGGASEGGAEGGSDGGSAGGSDGGSDGGSAN
jgi:hypothetical protein